MPKYLLQVSYTLEGIRGLKAEGGTARRQAAEEGAKSLGGTLEAFYFAFGENDVYAIADMPDDGAAAAMGLAITAAGGARTKTVVLLSPEQMDAAADRQVGYRPPGG
jgi:uncharacterized protein with GYD domain